MKKKIIVVEDRPWVTQSCVKKLQEKGVMFDKMLYVPNIYGDEKEKTQLIEAFGKNTGIEVKTLIGESDFIQTMDEIIKRDDVIILTDYDLKLNYKDPLEKRIHIQYAKEHKGTRARIYFYSTGGIDTVSALQETFPRCVLPVNRFEEGQLEWDVDKVMELYMR